MDIQTLKETIENLDPKAHKSLIAALTEKYNRLIEKKYEIKPQAEAVSDPFSEMFRKVADELNRRYIEGTIPYITEHDPDLYQKINKALEKIDEILKEGPEGKAGIEEFQNALKQWYFLLLQGIELYSKEQGKQRK